MPSVDPVETGWTEPAEVRPLAAQEFELIRQLAYRTFGLDLKPGKEELVSARLRRLVDSGRFRSFQEYYRHVLADSTGEALAGMIDALATNHTAFLREPDHFDFLRQQVVPALAARSSVEVWSAACSTGEEPYSIAMELLHAFPSGWELEVLASDLSTKVLDRAEAALWPIEKASEIPDHHRRAFMLRGFGAQEGLMKAGPEIRKIVRFARVNLVGEAWPGGPPFDLIFCRNVLIYFERQAKTLVVERLLDRLEGSGYLFLGHAESLGGFTARARAVLPTVYQPAARSGTA